MTLVENEKRNGLFNTDEKRNKIYKSTELIDKVNLCIFNKQ